MLEIIRSVERSRKYYHSPLSDPIMSPNIVSQYKSHSNWDHIITNNGSVGSLMQYFRSIGQDDDNAENSITMDLEALY